MGLLKEKQIQVFEGPTGESTISVRIENLKVVATALCRRVCRKALRTRRQSAVATTKRCESYGITVFIFQRVAQCPSVPVA